MMKEWISEDESAKTMVARVLSDRPFSLPPPLHRFPLRLGNVIEIVGPSLSAKTDILIQAAVSCILPKEWNGVHYGGSEKLAMFLDLDGRFDVLRLSQSLKHRIMDASGAIIKADKKQNDVDVWNYNEGGESNICYDEELYAACMRRFLYVCCYGCLEFLATLKTMRRQLQNKGGTNGSTVRLLLIDSIGALYWVDRGSTSASLGGNNRKNLSFQTVCEAVVQEIRTLMAVQSVLVLVTKSTLLADATNAVKRKWSSPDRPDLKTATDGSLKFSYREYMPSVWQAFVTHRILVRASDGDFDSSRHQNHSIYSSKWLLPSLNFSDKFTVREGGIFIVS